MGARLLAELGGLGFDVVVGQQTGAPSRGPLEARARAEGAFAAVRIVPSQEGVEVWIVDRVTGKTVLRNISLDPHADSPEAIVAVRTAELLRASLLETTLSHPARGEVEPSPEVLELVPTPAPAPASPRRPPSAVPPPPSAPSSDPADAYVGLGASLAASPGGVPPSGHLFVGYRHHLGSLFRVSALALLPTFAPRVEARGGAATFAVGLIGAGLEVGSPRDQRWQPWAGAGLGATWARLDGSGAAENAVSFAPYGRAGVGFAAARGWVLHLSALGGMTEPYPVVRQGPREVARWGRPFVVGTLGVDVALF